MNIADLKGLNRRLHASVRVLSACAALAVAGHAYATPEEDFKAAEQAIKDNDMISATPLYQKAADQGYAPAQAALARILFQAEYGTDAVRYYKMAAAQGNAEGEFGLGSMYAEGKGVKKDLKAAREWITKAAEQGYPQAVDVIADAYIQRGLGLDAAAANSPDALRWVTKSAEHEYVPSMLALAQAYSQGALGAPKDPAKAKEWQDKAYAVQLKFKNIRKKDLKKEAKR